jgi:hypothetical protein
MEPSNQTFQELLSNGVQYLVPRFQRDYAWDQEQWEDLWADIETLDEENYHYMGYIVLQRKGKHDFAVIDGQQRLVTLSLIVLATIKQIDLLIVQNQDSEANQTRRKGLLEQFIGYRDLVSLNVKSKLSLNRNNARHYKKICSDLKAPNLRGLTYTNKLLSKAYDFFVSKPMGSSGAEIASFIEKITSSMVFTKIVVQNELNAYKVFETLNARGVQLSTPDLLKNYIFSVITKNDDVFDETLNDLDENWSEIITQLGVNNFTDFIRYHHNFQEKHVTKKALFASIIKLAKTPQTASTYLKSLGEYAPIYASLLNPYDEWWANQGVDYQPVQKYLEGFSLFKIKSPFTILMVAFKKFSSEDFVKLVKYLFVLSIRYNVICHYSTSELEKRYNQIAIKVFHDTYKRASHIKNGEEFRKLYPKDDEFTYAFKFHKMPSRQSSKKIRFLLSEIETHLGQNCLYTKTVLEHICPYHPEQEWYDYFGEGVNDIQDRLGNFVLLEKDELKRADFNTKKANYLTTSFKLAKQVAEYDSWDLRNLNDYQEWLANQAVKTWRVD